MNFMNKFLAVLKREYKKTVFSWTFVITTFLMPLVIGLLAVASYVIFSAEGDVTRIVIVDKKGNVAARLQKNLSVERVLEKKGKAIKESFGNLSASQEEKVKKSIEQIGGEFEFVDFDLNGKSVDKIKRELNSLIAEKKLETYLIIPDDITARESRFELYSRKAGDFITNQALENALNEAVRSQRLADANISEDKLAELSRPVVFATTSITEEGNEKDNTASPVAGFIVAYLLFIILAIYGQAIMGAIVEEKETRISEILFSSAKPFELLMGKLVGVGLAGLTQLALWIASVLALVAFGVANVIASGMDVPFPEISVLTIIYFFIFFFLGYFIYATIYALIGSMVTNMQEGGQFLMPVIMIMLLNLYLCYPIVRDPNSTLSFWVSIAPFFATMAMPVRILSEIPPFWHVALAILLNGLTIVGLTWVASRVYRVGMLMYGKKATIPEVWKWIWQS